MIRRLVWGLYDELTRLSVVMQTRPRREQPDLLRSYARIRSRRNSGAGTASGRVRVLGMTVEYLGRAPLLVMFDEIFVRQDYAFDARTNTPFVVDAGANIGLATLYFKHRYPGARVLAFEPEPTTFATLERNVRENGLSDVRLLQLALGEDVGSIRLRGQPGSLGTTTVEGVWDEPPTDTVVDVARLSSFVDEPVDMLKLDIEGGEFGVLRELAMSAKLHLVREMVVEYHHHIGPTERSLGDLLTLLDANRFGYQVAASFIDGRWRSGLRRPSTRDAYQDILVYAYAKDDSS